MKTRAKIRIPTVFAFYLQNRFIVSGEEASRSEKKNEDKSDVWF